MLKVMTVMTVMIIMTNTTPTTHNLSMKFAELQAALLEANPTMPSLLREIHTRLKADPDNVTLLSKEEVALVIAGLSKLTMAKFAESVTSKKPSIMKSLKNANLEML